MSCPPGDNLMLHAAVHRAAPGSVIVVESGDLRYALAGGNVFAVAQRHGIAGFVADGVIRDLAEVRDLGLPVFARGIVPTPGVKEGATPFGLPVRCGGVRIEAGDVVVADAEGVVAAPATRARRPHRRPRRAGRGGGRNPGRLGAGPPDADRGDPEGAGVRGVS